MLLSTSSSTTLNPNLRQSQGLLFITPLLSRSPVRPGPPLRFSSLSLAWTSSLLSSITKRNRHRRSHFQTSPFPFSSSACAVHSHFTLRKATMSTKRGVSVIIDGGWVLPMTPGKSSDVLHNTSVVIDKDTILDILPTDTAHEQYTASQHLDRSSSIIMPGFVNAHTHAGMTFMRGRGDDKALMPWLTETVWPIEGFFAGKESFCSDATALACAEMIRGGVTTFADMYLNCESTAQTVYGLGMRAVLGLIMFNFPTGYASGPDAYHQRALKALKEFGYERECDSSNDQLKWKSLVTFAYAPHAPYTVKSADWERLRDTAKAFNIPIHTHLHETKAEVEASENLDRENPSCHLSDNAMTPLQDLFSLDVVTPRFAAAHMVHLSEKDIDICKRSGMHVIHCPTSNSKLGSGFCAAHKLASEGVNIALGTDSACSNNSLSILAEMRLAALNAKCMSGDATVFPAHEVLAMGTCNGAKALGLGSVTGSIQIGKKADVISFDVENTPGNSPMFDPFAAIVYAADRADVRDVVINGAVLLKEKEFLGIDVEHIMERTRFWKGEMNKQFPI